MRHSALAIFLLLAACASRPGGYNAKPVVTYDDDRHPVKKPSTYWSSNSWDGIDQQLFNRMSKTFGIETYKPSVNVNALGEVPDSSWFNNRLGQHPIAPERIVQGACPEGISLEGKTLLAKSGKTDGLNPGFVIEDAATHKKYLLKFDTNGQPERGTVADVMGSKMYWAFGYNTPCNFVVLFNRELVQLADGAHKTDSAGKTTPLTEKDVESALAKAWRLPDGRYRASASLFIEGEPIGPWRYEGTKSDDPNDVVAHQDRRELRAQRVLNAWLDHYDARDGNTYATFIPTANGKGYVKHYMVDFGDLMGSAVPSEEEWSRRIGRQYYIDWGDIGKDLVTLGFIDEPWERVEIDPAVPQLGYFEDQVFVPADWKPGYPNRAFLRMDDLDAYWAAQIIARFTDPILDALLDEGKMVEAGMRDRLRSVLIGRRNRVVHDYVYPFTSLERAHVAAGTLCFEDVVVAAGYEKADAGSYEVRELPLNGWSDEMTGWKAFHLDEAGRACVKPDSRETTVEARVMRVKGTTYASIVRFHIAGGALIGIERLTPED